MRLRKQHIYTSARILIICVLFLFATNAWGQEKFAEMPQATWQMPLSQHMDTNAIKKSMKEAKQLSKLHPDSAKILFDRLLKISVQNNYFIGVGYSLQELRALYIKEEKYDSALYLLKSTAVGCMLSPSLANLTPHIFNHIGSIYLTWNDNETAMLYFLNAAQMCEKLHDNAPLRYIYISLANVLAYFQQYDQAFAYLDSAEKLALFYKDYNHLAMVYANKGSMYSRQKAWDQCLLHYERTVNVADKYNLLMIKKVTLINIAEAYINRDMPQEALIYMKKADDVPIELEPYYQINSTLTLGRAYLALKDYKKAEQILLKALHSAEKMNADEWAMAANDMLSRTYAAMGKYTQAYKHHLAFAEAKDSSYSQSTNLNVNQLEAKFRVAQKDKLIAEKELRITTQQSDIKRQNTLIIAISIGALLVVLLLINIYRINKHRRRAQQKQIFILEQKQKIMEQEQKIGQLQAMMNGEEKERTRLAQDLHDGIGGMLAVIKMNINKVKKLHPELINIRPLGEIMSMVSDTAAQVRKTAHNLMPDVLLKNTLAEALMLYCDNITADSHLQIDLQFNGVFDELDKRIELVLYRIIQELLQNIIKHADATKAVIQFMQYNEKLSITVEDNGMGFDVAKTSSGLGLQNMRLRVQALGGSILVQSNPGMGTTIYIEFALKDLKNTLSYDH